MRYDAPTNEVFSARLLGRSQIVTGALAGYWKYAWREEVPRGGIYSATQIGRSGGLNANFAFELSNNKVDVTAAPLVWMRQRGISGGGVVYEFIAGASKPADPPSEDSVPTLTPDGDLKISPAYVTDNPVYTDPAGQFSLFTTTNPDPMTPFARLQVAQNGDGAGTVMAQLVVAPDGALSGPYVPLTVYRDGSGNFIAQWVADRFVTANGAGAAITQGVASPGGVTLPQWVVGNADLTMGNFVAPVFDSGGRVTRVDLKQSVWDGSAIRTTTQATTAAAGVVTTAYDGVHDFSAATVLGVPTGATWALLGTVLYTSLTTAGTGPEDEVVYTLAAKGTILGLFVRTKTAGAAAGLTALNMNLLIGATVGTTTGDGKTANDVTGRFIPGSLDKQIQSWTATTSLGIRFQSVGANLNTLTQGEWELYGLVPSVP